MTVRLMKMADLEVVFDWAATEGWNPGLQDAAAFFAADRGGFFVKDVDGAPVAAVSVVNHDSAHAFLGLYICRPEFRGFGYGIEVWRAGRAHAGQRCIGLDGVPEQQDNYIADGFTKHGRTIRFEGVPAPVTDRRAESMKPDDLPRLKEMDRCAIGYMRTAFLDGWLTGTDTRKTFVIRRDNEIAAYATYRKCLSGVKIGPLYAEEHKDMEALMAQAVLLGGAPVYVDVPEEATPFQSYLRALGFHPVFETARMYSQAPPASSLPTFTAVATLELG